MIEALYGEGWCVEEREIARLKEHGRRSSKKNRRVIGRAIRYWRRRLERSGRSVSVPIAFTGRAVVSIDNREIGVTDGGITLWTS